MLFLYTTLHYLVPQPGRLFQEPYIASIGVTPRVSEARQSLPARLLDAVEFSDTCSSPDVALRHPKFMSNKLFNGPVLLNLASKMD